MAERMEQWDDEAGFSPEVRERAVRLVLDNQGGHDSEWAAIRSVRGEDRLLAGDAEEPGAPSGDGHGEAPWAHQQRA